MSQKQLNFTYFYRVLGGFLLGCAVFVQGCATTSYQTQTDSNGLTIRDVLAQNGSSSETKEGPKPVVKDMGELVVHGVKLKNTQFDYPITINSKVEQWVDYFCCGKGRVHFERYLERSDYFIPYIDPILRQNNMPRDLVYLAMIESGFNNYARSHARAVGPWQFITGTGKRYGLMVNWWVDERRDVKKSTLSAVQYLKDLYTMFQSWELAAAAYNAGEAKVARAIRRYGTTDFWALIRHKFLRPETRNYVPKIIAAAIVAKNREQFGFQPARKDLVHPEAGEVLASDGSVVRVVKTEKPEDDLTLEEADAMAEDSDFASSDEDSAEEVAETASDEVEPTPMANNEEILAAIAKKGDRSGSASQETRKAPIVRVVPTPHITKDGQVGGEELAEFEVQSPADLLKVARAAGLSYHTVKSLNPELRRWCTPPHLESYPIRLPASVKDRFIETYNAAAYPRDVRFRTHKVRRGDTISRIARHYGIALDPLVQLNGFSAQQSLPAGREIKLPLPNDRSRSIASLDVRDPPDRRRRRRHHYRSRSYRSSRSSRKSSSSYRKVSYKQRISARKRAKKSERAYLEKISRKSAGG